MIFKNIEIYFLHATSKVRWGSTFALLLIIFFCWWHFAFAPLCSKLKSSVCKLENACTASQEIDQQALADSLNSKALSQRISFVGDYNYFLKDLLAHGLKTTNVTIHPAGSPNDAYTTTSVKLDFIGSFEKFYDFLREHQKNYLCLWNSCICTKSPEGDLSINAYIVIYSK